MEVYHIKAPAAAVFHEMRAVSMNCFSNPMPPPRQLMMIIGTNRTIGKKDMVKLHIDREKKANTNDYRIIKGKMQTSI